MDLLSMALAREVPLLQAEGVRIHFIGDRSRLKPKIQADLTQAELTTAENSRLVLNICFNYGGRWDIAQAAARLAAEGRPIDEANLGAAMALSHVPDPDLVIRTGGEHRISNFLLWQSAYSEFYFTKKLWPDFNESEFNKALKEFARRRRKYGK